VGLLNPHLDDDAFAQVWADRLSDGNAETGRPAERHLQSCADCRARFATFSTWLETVRTDARMDADEGFGTDRLAAQQSQIMRRLESLEHPARVIAFPRFAQPVSTHHTPRHRWVAAAAAAGLIVGVGLGQVLEFSGTTAGRRPAEEVQEILARRPEPTRSPVQPISLGANEEAFLYDQDELAPSQIRVPESLQDLNAITPLTRDFDPR
jgi:hypothetical protein